MRINHHLYESAETQTGKYEFNNREEIPTENKWKLEDIYESEEKWESAFNEIKSQINEYEKFSGKLSQSSEQLKNCIEFDEKIGIELEKLFLYAMLSKDLDLTNSKNNARNERIMMLHSELTSTSSFIVPEILEMDEAKVWEFVEEQELLQVYKFYFENLFRKKEYTLSPKEERILAMSQTVTAIPYNTFSIFDNADIQFPIIKNEKGEDVKISHGKYTASLYSQDRSYRERVYKNYYKPFVEYRNTLTTLFNGNINASIFSAKARNYKSTLEASLKPNNIPVEVYNNLINTVDENLEPMHRWGKIKKRVLKLDELHPYDSYVTLFPGTEKEYTYEESKEILIESLKPLGDDYFKNLNKAFDERWIDVFETKGKRSGAYSSGSTFGVHPFVLLNWQNQLNDVFTFTHEMGHNMHSHYTGISQPFPYANYSIFLAEVASTMNEALLLDFLIENASSQEEKLSLIEKHLNNVTTTFYRQARFADFEKTTHALTEAGEVLTHERLCELYGKNYKALWGNDMVVDDEETYTWARVPHFYYNFYVYQYATSFAASQVLVNKVKEEGESAIGKYLNFLKAGSSKYPIDVLKDAGVDMTSEEPIKAVVNKMNLLLDEMERNL
ncbi:MAG: oligoendopeptidase F [Melioribacteraceae bacterium]|nr:oligoendopeptidase F [Melioribacteraceae bacterium]